MQLENLFIDLRMFKGRGIHTCNAPSTYTEQELFAHTGEKKLYFLIKYLPENIKPCIMKK